MGIELADYGPKPTIPDAVLQRRAAVRIADQIGAEHPHPLDEYMPRIAGAVLAKDPVIAAGVLELLAALGIRPDQISRGNQ
jgi:hypothetical protein